MRLALLLLLVVLLGGCADVASLAETMNRRQISSCLWATGAYGPFVGVAALVATGGATMEQCRTLR